MKRCNSTLAAFPGDHLSLTRAQAPCDRHSARRALAAEFPPQARTLTKVRWRCLDVGYRVHCVRTPRTRVVRTVRTGMKPLICRSCCKAEWNHVCKGPLLAENERPTPKQAAPAPSWSSLSPRVVSEAQQQPIGNLRAMDDDNFRVAYNAVMAEYMRRRRAKQKAT